MSISIGPEQIAQAIGEGKEHQNGDGSWNTVCPAHSDKGPSLTVSSGQNGRILVHCHAGCKQVEVIDALKRLDLWPRQRRNWLAQPFAPETALRPKEIIHPRLGKAEASWEYRDLKGRLVGFISRFANNQSGKLVKELAPMSWGKDADSGKEAWCWKGFVKPRPLYRGHLLREHPQTPVLIVEGEKTADAAQLIVGEEYLVVTWPGGTKAVKYVDWSGLHNRKVYIWPDADDVGIRAAQQISDILLTESKAEPRIVDLPAGLEKGWDLADNIPLDNQFDPLSLIKTAKTYTPESRDVVDDFNEQFALVLVGDKTVVLWEKPDEETPTKVDLNFISPAGFNMLFGNKYVTMGRKDVPAPKVWMDSERRRTYQGVVFKPGIKTHRDYNLWRGFAYEPDPDGDFSLLVEHIKENVAHGDESMEKWVWAWFAQMFQNPGNKVGTSLALRGKQGTGKTVVGQHMGALFPAHYKLVDDPRYVTGQFNAHQASCLLMHADEAFFAGDPRHIGRLKGLVTSDVNQIEYKGKDTIETKNYMRLFISSNEKFIVPAAFEERRFAVQDMGTKRKQDRAFFKAMETQLKSGGYEGLLHHLLTMDVSTIDVGTIPNTDALADQKLHSMDPVLRFWFERLRDGEIIPRTTLGWPEVVSSEHLYQAYIRRATDWGERRRVADNAFGREIAALVPNNQLVRKRMSIKQLDSMGQIETVRTWGYILPSLDECRKAFDAAIGYKNDWDPLEEDEAKAKEADDNVPF